MTSPKKPSRKNNVPRATHKRRIKMPKREEQQERIEAETTEGVRKMLTIEIDDEITTVYDRIKKLKADDIFLMIPKRATVLQSIVNLKILKKKIDALKKNVTIITNDEHGAQLAQKIGMRVSTERIVPRRREPNKSALNVAMRPTRIAKKRLSISDMLRRDEGGRLLKLLDSVREKLRQRKRKEQYAPRIVIAAPNKQALFTLIVISVLVLLVIAYIALPGATIYLTPASNPIEQPVNITLLDFDKNRLELESHAPQVIASYAVTPPPFEKTITVNATGKAFEGTNARGNITIINERSRGWPLVASTRFQTENGIVFRIAEPVTVPPRRGSQNGELDATVEADPYDAFDQVVGERGNIGGTRFFLPGLRNEENRELLYAISSEPMTGGTTITKKTITEQDLAASLQRVKKELQAETGDRLKMYLAEQNALNKTNLTFLSDTRAITAHEPQAFADAALVGQELASFEVKGTIEARGVAFNRNELINVLKTELVTKKSPEKTIAKIDDENITYKIFETNENEGMIRLTATIRGIEEYEIDPAQENGARLAKKIKDHILGKRIADAVSYIQNLPEIDMVEVKSWPLWAPSIPSVADNVKIVVQEPTD